MGISGAIKDVVFDGGVLTIPYGDTAPVVYLELPYMWLFSMSASVGESS